MNLVDIYVANAVIGAQNISMLAVYDLNQLVVESYVVIRLLQHSDNGSYTCTATNRNFSSCNPSVKKDC